VGNSGTLLDSQFGASIDKHDVVIRCVTQLRHAAGLAVRRLHRQARRGHPVRYSDEKVTANRDIRVWHLVIENGY
jgi:hypothetical protein